MTHWPELLDSLVRERGRSLFGYGYVLTGSAADADDLVQTALVKVFSRPRRLESVPAAEAYVRQAMRTLMIDDRREARHRHEVGGIGADTAVPSVSPLTDVRDALESALRTLPPRERVCVVMRYFDDLPIARIATELGIAEGTVRKYIHEAIRRLGTNAEALGLSPDLLMEDHHTTVSVVVSREV